MPASKLASTFVLALIEDKSTQLKFLYFSTQLSLKILAKWSKTAEICLHFTVEYLTLFVKLLSARVKPIESVPFKACWHLCPCPHRGDNFALHCIPRNFLHRLSRRFWRIGAYRPKIMPTTERLHHVFVWGKWSPKNEGKQEKPQGHWTPPFLVQNT